MQLRVVVRLRKLVAPRARENVGRSMCRLAVVTFVSALAGVAGAAELAGVPEGVAGLRSEPARATIDAAMRWIATGIEIAGVVIIVVGAVAATAVFVWSGLATVGWPAAYRRYRAELARGILLGLELLVAADIIGTVALTPSFESLAVLGLIVLIRTFLSFSLEVEIEGRWPWRAADERSKGRPEPARERL